jgi:hypothetical protein
MSRPLRIEYENAFYHVMNRGGARQFIFHDEAYYLAFLETIGKACTRFKCIRHAYCLMGNHYHILIETPNGNLGRIEGFAPVVVPGAWRRVLPYWLTTFCPTSRYDNGC